MQISKRAEHIISKISREGFEAYVVGGCVRDLAMNKTPTDWDITTNATPDKILEIFSNYRTIPTGMKHGTITVMIGQEPFEVTTFRVDGEYIDGRRPENVLFVSDLNEDLRRRDFTMNAMAYNPQLGLFDPFCGMDDIKKGIIRAVGKPYTRFSEDALRILRVLRFSAVLGFDIEQQTLQAARDCASLLSAIARERITIEFEKLLMGDFSASVINLASEIFAVIFKSPLDSEGLESAPKDFVTRLAIAFKNSPDDLVSLILPNDTKLRAKRLIEYMGKDARVMVRDLGEDAIRFIDMLEAKGSDVKALRAQLKEIKERKLCCTLAELDVSGTDLIKAGIKPGKKLGRILNALLDEVISDKIENQRNILIKYAFDIADDL